MTTKRKNWLTASAALILACGVAVVCFVSMTRGGNDVKGPKTQTPKLKNIVLRRPRGSESAKLRKEESAVKIKATLDAARENEKVKLSDAYKALLAEIQAALDAEDGEALLKIVRGMQDSEEWPDGIPSVIHKAAIEAMEFFGTATAPELIGYLASSDGEVVESTLEAMEDMLSDVSIGDYERSDLLLNYAKVVKDADAIETMLMELDNMRPGKRAETVLALYEIDNPVLTNQLNEDLDTYFEDYDDVEVVTREDIPAFIEADKKAHEEDPELAGEEEELYGPDRDDD